MKSTHLISTLFFATYAVASSELSFYANISGTLKPITHLDISHYDYFLLKEDHHPPAPKFTLDNGVASTGYGADKKVFGIDGNYLALVEEDTSKIFHIELDNRSKLANINPYMCKFNYTTRNTTYFLDKGHSSKIMTCSPVDIYLLSPQEAAKRLPGKIEKDKYEIKNMSPEAEEHMESLIGSESSGSSAIDLQPRASVEDSQKANANKKAPDTFQPMF